MVTVLVCNCSACAALSIFLGRQEEGKILALELAVGRPCRAEAIVSGV